VYTPASGTTTRSTGRVSGALGRHRVNHIVAAVHNALGLRPVRSGAGTSRFANGNRYEGEWENGKINGEDLMMYA
jgi:hypothetical protein